MKTWLALADRTAVLFLGVAAGAAIGFAFAGEREAPQAVVPPAIAPPPPAAAAAPATTTSEPVARAQECAVPFQRQLLSTVAEGRPVRIGVFGDSFGDGVWSGLQRQLPSKQGFQVIKYSQQATGFTRYKSLNLEEHTASQIAEQPVDIAVISFGANDTQGVIANGHLATFMSPAWQQVIGGRAAGLVRLLRERGAMVYWVGLPRMRKAAFDADISNMTAFYERKMRELSVPFIDTRPVSSGPNGFAASLPDPKTGKETLMRAPDGIHMSMTGYVWITRDLSGRIRDYVAAARTVAGAPLPATPAAAKPGTPA